MSQHDPPAADLGAIRARLERKAPNRIRESSSIYEVHDVESMLAAYDAQAREIERLRAEVERLRDATTATS